jgi:hypothetical protein
LFSEVFREGWRNLVLSEKPECGDRAYMIDFGGLMSIGGGGLVCIGCGLRLDQSLGGLSKVSDILRKSPLKGTPFRHTSGRFGGTYPSDGAQLCAYLGVERPSDDETTEDGASLRINFPSGISDAE